MTSRDILPCILTAMLSVPLLLGCWQCVAMARAEQALAHAARAGAVEAMLPRATHANVEAAVRRSLASANLRGQLEHVSLWHNSRPVCDLAGLRLAPADKLCVLVRLPALAATRDYLAPLGFSLATRRLTASAARSRP